MCVCVCVSPVSVSVPVFVVPPPSVLPPFLDRLLSCWPWRHHAPAAVHRSCNKHTHTHTNTHTHFSFLHKHYRAIKKKETEDNKKYQICADERLNSLTGLWTQTTAEQTNTQNSDIIRGGKEKKTNKKKQTRQKKRQISADEIKIKPQSSNMKQTESWGGAAVSPTTLWWI